ncbi:MAG TPA: hypothetical protein VF786_09965 [Terriglobales bacterium]
MKHARMAALMFVGVLGLGTLATTAQAQDRDDYRPQVSPQVVLTQWGWGYGSASYNHGYRDGMTAGRKDAWKGIRPIPYEHGSYRDSGNEAYRDGFLRGYREGYGRNARGGWYNDGYRNDRWRDRDHDRDDRWRDRDDYYHDRDDR